MRELPTPLSGPTLEPISVITPRPLVRPSFLNQLERITKSPFKTPGPISTLRLPVSSPTPSSTGPDTSYTRRTGSIWERKIGRRRSGGDIPRNMDLQVCSKADPWAFISPKEALLLSNQRILLKKIEEVAGETRIGIG